MATRNGKDAKRRPDRRPRLARWLWFYKLSRSGRYFFIAWFLSGMLSGASLAVPIFQLASIVSAFFLVAFVVGFALRPRVAVRSAFPSRAVARKTITGVFELTNRSFLPCLDVGAGFFKLDPALRELPGQDLIPYLERGQSATATVAIEPLRRGIHTLPPVRVFSVFPFNILRSTGKGNGRSEPLLVLPSFEPLDGVDVPVGARYQPGGIALTSHIGESPEYVGNREYRAGDPTRHIDHRAWGRLARPVVREFMEEYYCRIALVMDTYVPPERKTAAGGFEDLEAGISLSASVADAMSRGEYIIDIFAAGPELYVFRAGRHTAHLDNVLEILAGVEACRKNPFETVAPALADELKNISAVVCVLLDWDRARQGLARAAAEAGCAVKILVVREGPTSEPLENAREIADSVVTLTPKEVRDGGLGVL